MTEQHVDQSRLKEVTDDTARQAILDAVSAIDERFVLAGDKHGHISHLAPSVKIDGVEALPDGLFWIDNTNNFEAVGTVYLTVTYSATTNTTSAMSDSLPVYIYGSFDGKQPKIHRVEVEASESSV